MKEFDIKLGEIIRAEREKRDISQHYAEQCHNFVGILWGFLQNKKAVN